MIEDRHAHFERNRHAGAIDLGEDVVGEIGDGVEILHAVERVWQRACDAGIEDRTLRLLAAIHERIRIVPGADQAEIAALLAGAKQTRCLVHLVGGELRTPLRRQETEHALP